MITCNYILRQMRGADILGYTKDSNIKEISTFCEKLFKRLMYREIVHTSYYYYSTRCFITVHHEEKIIGFEPHILGDIGFPYWKDIMYNPDEDIVKLFEYLFKKYNFRHSHFKLHIDVPF